MKVVQMDSSNSRQQMESSFSANEVSLLNTVFSPSTSAGSNELSLSASNDIIDSKRSTKLEFSLDKDLQRMEQIFEYILKINEPGSLVTNEGVVVGIKFVANLTRDDEFRASSKPHAILAQYTIEVPFSAALSFYFDEVKLFVNRFRYSKGDPEQRPANEPHNDRLKRVFALVVNILEILWQFSDRSIRFCYKLHEAGGTKCVLDYLADESFVSNCKRLRLELGKTDDIRSPGIQLLCSIIGTCHNISKTADNTKQDWHAMGATEKLMKFADKVKKHSTLRVSAYLCIANVVNDSEIENLADTQLVIRDVVQLVKLGAVMIADKEHTRRARIDLNGDDMRRGTAVEVEVAVVEYNDSEFRITELLEGLCRIAVNDSIKYDIYVSFALKQSLTAIIADGNEVEREHAMKLLFQVAYDSRVCDEIVRDKVLCKQLKDLQKSKNASSELRSCATGTLWLVGQKALEEFSKENNKEKEPPLANDPFAMMRFSSRRRFNKSSEDQSECEGEESENGEKKLVSDSRNQTEHKHPKRRNPRHKKEKDDKEYKNKTKNTIVTIDKSPIMTIGSLLDDMPNDYLSSLDLYCEGETKEQKNENINLPQVSEALRGSVPTNHIMISYNRDSRDLCLKIKKELESAGYKIWIDVEDISGSSLESMAKAIENARAVLICVTEKYKQSPNCRAEAEYSFSKQKPIVPLIMQPNYFPDGWLGIIMGSKIFVNFTKYSFEECIRRTKFELKNALNETPVGACQVQVAQIKKTTQETKIDNVQKTALNNSLKETTGPETGDDANCSKKEIPMPRKMAIRSIPLEITPFSSVTPIVSTPRPTPRKWTAEEVATWMQNATIDPDIQKALQSFNGELLAQFHSIRRDAPEFFFASLTQQGQVELHAIVHFTNELNKLAF